MTEPRPEAVLAYYDGGAAEEITLRENEEAWRGIRFRPHVLRNVSDASTRLRLLDVELDAPVLIAPMALHGLAHPSGEIGTARGASHAGALFVLSTRSSMPLEQVAAVTTGPWWFQVYAMRDRSITFDLAERAARAGATALVLTGDAPVLGSKKRGTPGIDVPAIHLRNLQAHYGSTVSPEDIQQDPSADADLIGRLQRATGLPVLVKGVLRADDAIACLDAGAAAVIVSNHGGRQLDRAVATARALSDVVGAVDGAAPILVDGGIRVGADVLGALALGADAVLVGRPILHGLMSSGAEGVARVLTTLRTELLEAMMLSGAPSLDAVGRDLLVD